MKDLHDFHARIARCQENNSERPVFVSFFGDSNTRGWGNGSIQYREAFPSRLIEALHERYPGCAFNGINSGVAGDTLTEALERLERDVLRYTPDLVIICFGLNDAMKGLNHLPQFEESLRTTLRIIRTQSAVVLLTPNMMATHANALVPQPYQEIIDTYITVQTQGILDAYVQTMYMVASEVHVPLADTYRLWKQMEASGIDTTLFLANGINHPFGHAHRFFIEALLPCIEDDAKS